MEKKGFNFNKLIGFNVFTITLVLIVFLGGVGLTYAYYAFSYEEESVIAGNVINVDLDLEVDLVVGTNEEMVPLQDAALSNALNAVGSPNGACVDQYNNLSCQVYKITVINKGSRVKHLTGTIELYAKEGEGNVYNNLKWREITNPTTIKSDAVVNGMEESVLVSDLTMESKTERTWYIAVWISETDSDQRETDKGVFGGTVKFEAGSGGTGDINVSNASQYIINKYNDGSSITTINIGGDTSNPQVYLNSAQGIMLDNNGEYRYYGADPNNYVSYNDELWRIISVSNVKSSEIDTVGETRVKIVKADNLKDDNDLANYSYDSSAGNSSSWVRDGVNSGEGVNDWSQADLMTELNTIYLNSTSGTCYTGNKNATTACNFTNTGLNSEARNLTGDALYYLGTADKLDNLYPNGCYTIERGTTVYNCSKDSCGGPRATTWVGRIGLIYLSDYAYATDLNLCTIASFNLEVTKECYENDWLYTSDDQWTISPNSSAPSPAYLVLSTGGKLVTKNVYTALVIRPVQYLKSEVMIVGGEGTEQKPYILEI